MRTKGAVSCKPIKMKRLVKLYGPEAVIMVSTLQMKAIEQLAALQKSTKQRVR